MTPNQIIAALLDIASAAFALQHDAKRLENGSYMVDKDDLGTIHERLWRLDQLPQPEGEPPRTGPAKARHAMQSFLVDLAVRRVTSVHSVGTDEQVVAEAFYLGQFADGHTPTIPVKEAMIRVLEKHIRPAEKSLVGRVLINAYLRQHPEAGDLSHADIVQAIVNLIDEKSATYADAYVEKMQHAVADLSVDGRRFRTMLFVAGDLGSEAVAKAVDRMSELAPESDDELRDALDTLAREGLVPECGALVDGAIAAEKLRQQALALAGVVVNNHKLVMASGGSNCMYCGAFMEVDESANEFVIRHKPDCPVNLAKQIIEDQQ